MLFAHLTVFCGFIASTLFLIRSRQQLFAEKFLSLFSTIFFLNSVLFLSYQYYHFKAIRLLDYSGVISEIICLLLPMIYVTTLFNNVKRRALILWIYSGFMLFSVSLHFLISDHSKYLFYHVNKNAVLNVKFQILIDLFIFVLFIYQFFKIRKAKNDELFDGNFKSQIGIMFIIYYLQDLIILLLMAYFTNDQMLNSFVFSIGNISNALISIILISISIQTNWLQEWHIFFSQNKVTVQKLEDESLTRYSLRASDLLELPFVDYAELKHHFKSKFNLIFLKIDQTENLTKNERLYYFLLHFEITHKELADILNVSNRTVETNFYRIRKKLELLQIDKLKI